MNVSAPARSNAPRIALIAPAALCLVSVAAIVVVLMPFIDGAHDHRIAQPFGAPATTALLLAVVVATAWWVASGELRIGRRAFLSTALLLLPLCGVLAAAQGAETETRFLGGLAGRNLVYPFTSNGVGPAAPLVVYGLVLLFGLYFSKRALTTTTQDHDPSAVLARLSQRRVGKAGDAPEIPAPSADEGVGLPSPVAGERDLFAPDAELAEASELSDREIPTAFQPSADEDDAPPPPPRRRRVLEDIVPEEEFVQAVRADEEARERNESIYASSAFGAGVVLGGSDDSAVAVDVAEVEERGPIVDVDDDEDVLSPSDRGGSDTEDDGDASGATEVEEPPTDDSPFGSDPRPRSIEPQVESAAGASDEESDEPTERAEIRAPEALVAQTSTPVVDDRERLEDAVDADQLATAAERSETEESESPLFAAPPRIAPLDDDDLHEIDDLPTGDDDDASMGALATDDVGDPPPARPDHDAEGGRTGEAPRRAIVTDDAEPGLFGDDAPEEIEQPTTKRARPRAARKPKSEEVALVEAAAEETAADEADSPFAPKDDASPAPTAEAAPAPIATPEPAAPVRVATPRARPVSTRAPVEAKDDFETLVGRAAEVVVEAQRCSPSLLQRELGVRFVEAAAIIERLHARGVVGPHTPSGVRDVLVRATNAEA